jgi:hypothetical protein
MEKKKIYWMIGMFLVGAVIGCVITALVCCNCNTCCKKSCKMSSNDSTVAMVNKGPNLPDTAMTALPLDSAKAYFKCYMKSPRTIKNLVAFYVNADQLHAMNVLTTHQSSAKGFRIYMGVMGDPVPVNMVVATDVAGKDICSEIYLTKVAEPCPTLCDDQSPITK